MARAARGGGYELATSVHGGFPRTRRQLVSLCMYVCLFVCTRVGERICASPTIKRSVRKYNYSEEVTVRLGADDAGADLTIITSHRNN